MLPIYNIYIYICIDYFISKIDEIWRENYNPTFKEGLMVRKRTFGKYEKSFFFDRDRSIDTFVDVGGSINGMCNSCCLLF